MSVDIYSAKKYLLHLYNPLFRAPITIYNDKIIFFIFNCAKVFFIIIKKISTCLICLCVFYFLIHSIFLIFIFILT